ncbi:diguanylate cyclase [Eubacteriales bacterium OttesenSCG-928-N13]|nr:diguanylate cyclase [Eubacteriales bacterium OttesenSCG-928-N13]
MKERRLFQLSNKEKYSLFTAFVVFCALIMGITVYMNNKTINDSHAMLEKSVEYQLISVASAAREIIDEYSFVAYNSLEDIDNNYYRTQREQLCTLQEKAGAQYIYALKMQGDDAVFVYDTDVEAEPFITYDLDDALERAFQGEEVTGISNVDDEYGSFSTAAVPLYKDEKIIGVVAVDIEDKLIIESRAIAKRNVILMVCILGITLLAMSVLVYILLNRMKKMQDKLKRMANYDKLTNLPNRQYLMDYLAEITSKGRKDPFALLFVDLDNFKKVNDNAGHDAGDALLQNIGHYLDNAQTDNKRVFRPGAGPLNIAARIGGDEFVLIAPGISNELEANAFARQLLDGFGNQEIDRYIEKYEVGLSIGVALYPFHTDNYNVLIKYADIAMYHAKFGGKNCYRIYDDEMSSKEEK